MQADTRDVRELIGDVDRVRRRSRARASTMWFPLVLFGMLSLVSAGVVVVQGAAALGPYWSVAGPAGGVATAVYATWWGYRVGVELRWVPYVGIALLILAGSFVLGAGGVRVGMPMVSAVGPPLMISLGHLLFAWLEHSRVLAGVAVMLAATAVAFPLAGVEAEHAAAWLAAAYGLAFLVTGLVLVWRVRRR